MTPAELIWTLKMLREQTFLSPSHRAEWVDKNNGDHRPNWRENNPSSLHTKAGILSTVLMGLFLSDSHLCFCLFPCFCRWQSELTILLLQYEKAGQFMASQTRWRETVNSTNCFDVLLLSHYLSSNILHFKYRRPPFVALIIIHSERFHLQCEPILQSFPPSGHLLNNLSLSLSLSFCFSVLFVSRSPHGTPRDRQPCQIHFLIKAVWFGQFCHIGDVLYYWDK